MSTAGMLHRMQELNVGDGKEDIAYILGWKDTSPTIFSEYLVWADTREKNKNKRLMKITNATKIPKISSKSYMESKSDRDNARKVAELVNIISCEKYLSTLSPLVPIIIDAIPTPITTIPPTIARTI